MWRWVKAPQTQPSVDVEPMLGRCSVTLLHNTTLAEGMLFESGASKRNMLNRCCKHVEIIR